MGPKIATCCYCGTRAALELHGRERHELACASCGAPLHDLKMMPMQHKGDPARHYSKPLKQKKSKGHKKYESRDYYHMKDLKKKKAKKSKGWGKKLFDGVDDLFDLFD